MTTIPDAPPALPELVSQRWNDRDPEVAALARLAKESRDRAVVAWTLLRRGSDGNGGWTLDDAFTADLARTMLGEAIAEMNSYLRELEALASQRRTNR